MPIAYVSFLIRLVAGILFVRPFYSHSCIQLYTHHISCSFQYTKGFEELCEWKISTQDTREEAHNLTDFSLKIADQQRVYECRRAC